MANKETASVVLVLVTILAVFAVVQPLIPSNSQKFSELGVLGPNQTISGYPTSVTVGQQISLYGYVGNHLDEPSYYQVLVKLGNQSTQISNSTSASAPELSTYYHVLANNQSWIFPINLTMSKNGINQRIIFELWAYNDTTSSFTYTGLWNQLWINVPQP